MHFNKILIKNLFYILLFIHTPLLFSGETINNQEIESIEQISTPLDISLSPNQDILFDESEFDTLSTPELNKPEDNNHLLNNLENLDDFEPTQAQLDDNNHSEALLQNIIGQGGQYDKLDFDLEHIALVVNNNQVRISNKKPILEEIIKLRSIVGMIKGGAFVVIRKENVAQLVELLQKLINHTRSILTTDLINFKSFDFEATMAPNRNLQLSHGVSFEYIESIMQQNDSLLTKLESESENVGLSTFNKAYRKLEKLNRDYKILNRVAIATAVGIGATWLLYRIHPAFFEYFKKNEEAPKTELSENDAKKQAAEEKWKNDNERYNNLAFYERWLTNPPRKPNLEIKSNQNIADDLYKKIPGDKLSYYEKQQMKIRSQLDYQQALSEAEKANDNPKNLPFIKRLFGSPLTQKEIKEGYTLKGKGIWPIFEDTLQNRLGLISFAASPIAIFPLIGPKLIEVGKKSYEWTKGKFGHVASFLRGGPIKQKMANWEKEVKITFADIIGNEHAKKSLQVIIDYIADYENHDRAGIVPETGFILQGPPRTGKTYLAEGCAGEITKRLQENGSNEIMRFLPITASELKEIGISNVLLGARQIAPILIFIDEIDTGRFQREGDAAALGELQVAMSTLNRDKSKKVIVMCATNKPENLDFSLTSAGRFGKQVDFGFPTVSERKTYLLRELAKRSISIEDEYIDKLAHESEDCSYDALNEVIINALQKAKKRGSVLTWQDLDAAFDSEIYKIILDENPLPAAEQYVIAGHQAAHAYMRLLLNASLQLTKVTIRPTAAKIAEQSVYAKYYQKNENKDQKEIKGIEYGRVFTAHNSNSLKFETHQDLINELMINLAGHVAEKILFDSSSFTYHKCDNERALGIAKHIAFGGMNEKDMPKMTKQQKLTEAYELVQKYEQKAIDLLSAHKEELIVITNNLFEHKTLLASDIVQIIELLKEEKDISVEATDEPLDGESSLDNDSEIDEKLTQPA